MCGGSHRPVQQLCPNRPRRCAAGPGRVVAQSTLVLGDPHVWIVGIAGCRIGPPHGSGWTPSADDSSCSGSIQPVARRREDRMTPLNSFRIAVPFMRAAPLGPGARLGSRSWSRFRRTGHPRRTFCQSCSVGGERRSTRSAFLAGGGPCRQTRGRILSDRRRPAKSGSQLDPGGAGL